MKGDLIVFVNQNAGYLMIDIINAHQRQYKKRAFITGKINPRDTPLDAGVKIEKIIAYNRSTAFKRLFTWIWGFVQILVLVKTKYRHADLYIVSNPPFSTLIPLLCKNKFNVLIFDVYPDALVEYKILNKNSFIVRMWRNANKRLYSKAQNIFTLSGGMKALLGQYVPVEKIRVAPVWTDNSFLKPIPRKENPFILKHLLNDKFLVIYSGNLGYTHNPEVLVECARKIKDSRVVFVIIGEGEKKRLLVERINFYKLENCMLLPWQDISVLPYSLAAADLGVVSLGKEASHLSVPSKTYDLMSVGAPLLCVASEQSELAELVNRYQLGKCFDPSEVDAIVAYIEDLASNKELHASMHSRALIASKDFGSENAFKLVV